MVKLDPVAVVEAGLDSGLEDGGVWLQDFERDGVVGAVFGHVVCYGAVADVVSATSRPSLGAHESEEREQSKGKGGKGRPTNNNSAQQYY